MIPDVITNAMIVKVNVDGMASEEISEYMQLIRIQMTDKRLEEQGYMFCFIPVRYEPTKVTFIDLETMNSASA